MCRANALFFPEALHLTKTRIVEKSTMVQQNARVAKLEEANAQLLAKLNAARSSLAEVERREQALTSDYEGLCWEFDDLRTSHDAVVKEKADLEKIEREKVQRFWNFLRKKLAELQVNMEATVDALRERCMDFPSANTTVTDFLEWFRTEVHALPIAFSECNENITCFTLIGVIKMLAGLECGPLPELKKLVLSCDDSLLHDVPDDVGRIAKRLVKNWWVKHALPYCMQNIEEENWVSFASMIFILRRCIVV
jgi:hypothetical protein